MDNQITTFNSKNINLANLDIPGETWPHSAENDILNCFLFVYKPHN